MNRQVDSTRGYGYEWKFLLAFTVLSLLVALSCAGARLDPEHNQALTFDTVPVSDAGLPTEGSNEHAVKHAPSQPASPVVEIQTPLRMPALQASLSPALSTHRIPSPLTRATGSSMNSRTRLVP